MSHSDFPLYQLLEEKTKDEPLSTQELIELVEHIRSLDKNGMDLVFVIIRIYSLKQNTSTDVNDVPYNGQKMDATDGAPNANDVKFDIRQFPNKLNRMLLEFSKMHLSKDKL
jgi:hypothetical protein